MLRVSIDVFAQNRHGARHVMVSRGVAGSLQKPGKRRRVLRKTVRVDTVQEVVNLRCRQQLKVGPDGVIRYPVGSRRGRSCYPARRAQPDQRIEDRRPRSRSAYVHVPLHHSSFHSERQQDIAWRAAQRARISGRGEQHTARNHRTGRPERSPFGGHTIDRREVLHRIK